MDEIRSFGPLAWVSKRTLALRVSVVALHAPVAVAAGTVLVSVTQPDLRPVAGVELRLTGAAPAQTTTDALGLGEFADVPVNGTVTVVPARSGFRFEPRQQILGVANPTPVSTAFTAFPTTTDLAVNIEANRLDPLIGEPLTITIRVTNPSINAATEARASFGGMPGFAIPVIATSQGTTELISTGVYSWQIGDLEPGAAATVTLQTRTRLPDSDLLLAATIDESEQVDTNPANDLALLTIKPQTAFSTLQLSLTSERVEAKVGETIPLRLTVKNLGPDPATDVVLINFTPPGIELMDSGQGKRLGDRTEIGSLPVNEEREITGNLLIRRPGLMTNLISLLRCDQRLPNGADWPEARLVVRGEPASAQLRLTGRIEPAQAKVGDTVTIEYELENLGPDAVSGLDPFYRTGSGLELLRARNFKQRASGSPLAAGETVIVSSQFRVRSVGPLVDFAAVNRIDQTLAGGQDYPEARVVGEGIPADVTLSLDVAPTEFRGAIGDPVTFQIRVHNAGPDIARGVTLDTAALGIGTNRGALRFVRSRVFLNEDFIRESPRGVMPDLAPGDVGRLEVEAVAVESGVVTNSVQIITVQQLPQAWRPLGQRTVRIQVDPGPLPDLAMTMEVDPPEVGVGEPAIFRFTVFNRGTRPVPGLVIEESTADLELQSVRSYGPDVGAARRSENRHHVLATLAPGASAAFSRTLRSRTVGPHFHSARIAFAGGASPELLARLNASARINVLPVRTDLEVRTFASRTAAKVGDPVVFAIATKNSGGRPASNIGVAAGASAGFQALGESFDEYGYFVETARPTNLLANSRNLPDSWGIQSGRSSLTFGQTYVTGAGPLTAGAGLRRVDQIDTAASNNLGLASITAAPASARVTLKVGTDRLTPVVGELVGWSAEIRNLGPDRVTGLVLRAELTTNLSPVIDPRVLGNSVKTVEFATDDRGLIRLPALEPGQMVKLFRGVQALAPGAASLGLRVVRFDQTAIGPLARATTGLTIQPAAANLALEWFENPATTAPQGSIVTYAVRVRNLGPDTATGIELGVTTPFELSQGSAIYGPRTRFGVRSGFAAVSELRPGESAVAAVDITPIAIGLFHGSIGITAADQSDPDLNDNRLDFTLQAGPALNPFARVTLRHARQNFFNGGQTADIQIETDGLGDYQLESSTDLRVWRFLHAAGRSFPVGQFTDENPPDEAPRFYRLGRPSH